MRRLRATINVNVDIENMEEFDNGLADAELIQMAKDEVTLLIDGTNYHYMATDSTISMSDIIKYEMVEVE